MSERESELTANGDRHGQSDLQQKDRHRRQMEDPNLETIEEKNADAISEIEVQVQPTLSAA